MSCLTCPCCYLSSTSLLTWLLPWEVINAKCHFLWRLFQKNDFCQTRLLQTVCLNCLGEKIGFTWSKNGHDNVCSKTIFSSHCSMTLFVIDLIQKKMKFLSNHAVSALLPGCKNTPKTHAFHLFALSMLSKSQKFQVNASHPHCWSRKHLKMAWDTEAGQNRPIMSRTAKTGHNLKVDHASPKQQPMSRMTRKVIPVLQCCRIASKLPTTPANHLYGLKCPNLPKHVNESDSKHLVSNAGSRRKCLSGYVKGKRCNTRHSVGDIYIYVSIHTPFCCGLHCPKVTTVHMDDEVVSSLHVSVHMHICTFFSSEYGR
jgi:hypothetical protein